MGYANPAQLSSGIHTRQYARAFVMEHESTRVVYVNVDCAMIDQIVKTEVSSELDIRNVHQLRIILTAA